METKNISSCHSDHSGSHSSPAEGGIPLDQVIGNNIQRNNKTPVSSLTRNLNSKSAIKRDTSTSLGKTTRKKLSGFTLVELIVVITILAILGTIAFTSLQGFTGSARDSSRVSDINGLSKSLEMTYIKTNSYPSPDNSFSVTYSGGTIWTQGTIGDTVMNVLGAGGFKLSKKPTDPLNTSKEYTYSKLFYGSAYQIKTDWEGDSVAYSKKLSDLKTPA